MAEAPRERDTSPGQSRFSPKLSAAAALLCYLALSLAFFERNVNWSQYYLGYVADSSLFIWCLHWWPYALTHGLNPFLCKYIWFPAGYNFAWATSIPLLAILMWPVTVLGSPVLSYNILTFAAPALAAWTACLLAHELTRSRSASLVGGFLFGFSAPELVQTGELNIAFVFLVPLVVLICIRRLRGRLNRRSFVILLSVLLAAQLGLSTEMLALLCIGGALTWFVFLLFAPAAARGTFWRLAVDVALAAPLTICLTAPFLYYLVIGLPQIPGNIHPLFFLVTDLLNFLVPGVPFVPVQSGWAALVSIAREFRGFRPGFNVYLSIPMLLMVGLYVRRHIRAPYVRALLVLLCIFAILGLGPRLEFNGRTTGIPLPAALFAHIPVLATIVVPRFLFYFTLGITLIAACWLAEAKTRRARVWRFGLAALACLCLPPAKVHVLRAPWQTHTPLAPLSALVWSRWPSHPFFTPAHISQALGPMPNVLILPDPVISPGMAWQLESGMNFTQAAGYIGFRFVNQQKWSAMDDFIFGHVMPDFGVFFPAFCAAHKVDFVLIAPGTPANVTGAIEALGWPHHMDDGIEIVKTPYATP